jgi:hypothetical protein
VPGKIGSHALQTVGNANANVDTFVTLGTNSPSLLFGSNDDFSVSFWVNYTGDNNSLPMIGNALAGPGHGGWVITDEEDSLQYSFQSTDNTNFANVTITAFPPSPINDGAWHHVVLTLDKTNFLAVTYVDGAAIDTNGTMSVSLDGLGSFVEAGDPTIGSDPTGTYNNFNGIATYTMDDLAIWRRLLSPSEVAAIYTLGQSGQSFGSVIIGLTITQVSGGIQINWPSGTLWSSGSVAGPWAQVSGATPPSYQVAPGGSVQFYLVK